ncbi:fasciculation and elongation protein zeta-2 [Denticeps clupeoides]|uniref:Fasciculation and elongation protein zeta 2 n=1 Tax=Denticeps clupeoides TaxID=299321 RepID=A0AAY4B3T4_9TELE|nr:fasciculation and elongation protein zeta-2-like [Denticeps clupeoides]
MAVSLGQLDEDWQDFNEFRPTSDWPSRLDPTADLSDSSSRDSSSSSAGDRCSLKSAEEPVDDFEAKLNACFSDRRIRSEDIAPVRPITEENFLKDDEIWNALTGNYGNVMPVDWKMSHTRSLHLPTLNLCEQQTVDGVNLDLSDDEELREQMDMHCIIVSCVSEEPLFTAEQVIEEIEEMMQSPDAEDDGSTCQSDLSLLSQDTITVTRSSSINSYEERVRGMSAAELTELLEEVEASIRCYSEELIQQLALRDELEYEKEVKNSFISVLIEVQNRQKEHRELLKKKIRGGATTQRSNRTHVPGTYLTTVIPYDQKSSPPSVEDLQILTKILHAMRQDSDKVPSLLTDYILKVLCPS